MMKDENEEEVRMSHRHEVVEVVCTGPEGPSGGEFRVKHTHSLVKLRNLHASDLVPGSSCRRMMLMGCSEVYAQSESESFHITSTHSHHLQASNVIQRYAPYRRDQVHRFALHRRCK